MSNGNQFTRAFAQRFAFERRDTEFGDHVMYEGARQGEDRRRSETGRDAREALPLLRTYADTPEVAAARSRFALPDLKQEAKLAIQAIQ